MDRDYGYSGKTKHFFKPSANLALLVAKFRNKCILYTEDNRNIYSDFLKNVIAYGMLRVYLHVEI